MDRNGPSSIINSVAQWNSWSRYVNPLYTEEFLRSTLTEKSIGKTILASVIVESLLNNASDAVSYFYCREDDPEKNDCISIFRGLLSQLLNHCRDIVPFCHEKHLQSGELNLTSLGLAERLLTLVFEMIPKQFIIIDGLDECDIVQRKSVLALFTSIVERLDEREPGKLRILFVSQDFSDIRKALETATVLDLSKEDNKNDIKSYINHWSKMIEQKYHLNTEDTEFIQESTLIRSQGIAPNQKETEPMRVANSSQECSSLRN